MERTRMSLHNRRLIRTLVVASLLGSLAVPGAAPAAPVYPTVAGTTIITGRGIVGVTLMVPQATTLPDENITVQTRGASFAFVGMAPNEAEYPLACADSELCIRRAVFFVSDVAAVNPDAATLKTGYDPPVIGPGLTDVYIVSDGEVTLTARFADVSGELRVEATGEIDASFERLQPRCPVGDCRNLGYGGAARDVRAPGYAAALSYAVIPHDFAEVANIYVGNVFGSTSPAVCLYPHPHFAPGASPRPGDHSTGCDFVPDAQDPGDALLRDVIFIGSAACRCIGGITAMLSYQAQGQTYAGFAAEQVTAVGEGRYGGYGLWVSRGVGCTSGDFYNCLKSEE